MTSSFTSEDEMLWPLTVEALKLFGPRRDSQGLRIFYEVPAAAGVPDMLLVRFDGQAIASRLDAGLLPVTTPVLVRALIAISRQPVQLGAVAGITGLSIAHLKSVVLPDLAARGYASEVDGKWSADRTAMPVLRSAVAVEVKRREWRRALAQARRYSRFVNASYVAIDRFSADPAIAWASDMADTGVGLATVDTLGQVKVWSRPRWKRRPPVTWEAFLLGERLWDLALKGQQRGPRREVFGRPDGPTPGAGARSRNRRSGE